MTEKVRWGVLGPGRIARSFARGLQVLPDAELAAVGSRSQERADAFGDEFDVPRRHPSYEALAQDDGVDVVYVATPHPFHAPCARFCLEAGKPVLVEKPLTINAREALELVQLARHKKLFLMEGMWTRFWPCMYRLRELLREEAIGDVRMLTVDFCFRTAFDPKSRFFDPSLGGGTLLDLGVYCISLSSMVFGKPVETCGLADVGKTGVDEQAAWVLRYDGGRLAIGCSSLHTCTPHEARLFGTEGSILVHSPWFKPQKMTIKGREMSFPLEGTGFNYEAAAVMECLREGKLEHEVMPLDESVDIMRTMDGLRERWGIVYPTEQ